MGTICIILSTSSNASYSRVMLTYAAKDVMCGVARTPAIHVTERRVIAAVPCTFYGERAC